MDRKKLVRRIFAVKRTGCDVEAQSLLHDLRDSLGIRGLTGVRIFNRYDLSGVTDAEYESARTIVFSEPPVDDVFDETIQVPPDAFVFAVEALPGQYDQRADSAAQCVQFLTGGDRPECRSARVYCLTGELAASDRERVKAYLVNPVDAREASLDKPDTLEQAAEVPEDIPVIDGFRGLDLPALDRLRSDLGLAMTLDDLRFCQPYFRDEGRDPTLTEIRVLDTYWSDHCRHTTFLTRLEDIRFDGDPEMAGRIRDTYARYLDSRRNVYGEKADNRPVCLMDLATIAAKELRAEGRLPRLDVSEEINACSIRTTVRAGGEDRDYLVMFKNETHNHPTEIEPFGGAATCLGGAIRDPLSGRSYVYQAMRVTGSGDPTAPAGDTIPGKLWQRKITRTAAAGFSSYGNQIGLATGQVDEIYHPGYVAKRMEIGAVIAAAPVGNVVRERPRPGDVIVLLGGRTGRDGCGGATGSSKGHDETSLASCGSEVQKGNPVTERKLQRLFRDPAVSRLIRRCNDFGAGGVSVAIGELAEGVDIDLDAVPKKYDGLDGTELAISESQERMAVVIDPADLERFVLAADKENLEAVPVAAVTECPRMVMHWRGREIVNLARSFIDTNGAPQRSGAVVAAPAPESVWPTGRPAETRFAERLKTELSRLENCSRKGLAARFDSTIGAGTVLMPFGGSRQSTPEEGMAAKIPVLDGETDDCTLMAYGFDPWLSARSPYHGAYYAVAESVARIVAMGGDPQDVWLTFQEYFERMRDEQAWGKPLAALLGAYRAQRDFGLAAIGGKDSMSGSFMDLNVPPTLVSFAVGFARADRIVSAALADPDSVVFLLRADRDGHGLPDPAALSARFSAVHALMRDGSVRACATVRSGGVAVAVARMCFGNGLGFRFETGWDDASLFADDRASLLVAVSPTDTGALHALDAAGAVRVGSAQKAERFDADGGALPLADALAAWEGTLEPVFPGRVPPAGADQAALPAATGAVPADAPPRRAARPGSGRPTVFIPVFPGTNCEYDTARVFERAGAKTEILVVRNITPRGLSESMEALRDGIARAQILMLPGGFSAGDEPEGSGKFIAAALREPHIVEEIHRLLQARDGLVLGICNGFQALMKLGLLPYGKIEPLTSSSPTLTFNRIGRHVSSYVRTRVVSNRSPWLSLVMPGDMHAIPVSHGEGRFTASDGEIRRLALNGQIATQYVDEDGRPSMDSDFNPNGSSFAVEGITSPDGRIFGKMGHSERSAGAHLAVNIPGDKDQRIFEAGVSYFRS
ncbi:MAG: phosphoribosylformylglycinamidine synthase [Clostridia bacterium]|nr:phosphoribosylformylglycinamidine synthase [Clostridia bacterium]